MPNVPDLVLASGDVAWATLAPVRGREQGGHRPVLVLSSSEYHDAVTTLVIVAPITSVDRGWPNHVRVDGPSGLDRPSWIMTEQPRTLSRDRLMSVSGHVSAETLRAVRTYISDFLDL